MTLPTSYIKGKGVTTGPLAPRAQLGCDPICKDVLEEKGDVIYASAPGVPAVASHPLIEGMPLRTYDPFGPNPIDFGYAIMPTITVTKNTFTALPDNTEVELTWSSIVNGTSFDYWSNADPGNLIVPEAGLYLVWATMRIYSPVDEALDERGYLTWHVTYDDLNEDEHLLLDEHVTFYGVTSLGRSVSASRVAYLNGGHLHMSALSNIAGTAGDYEIGGATEYSPLFGFAMLSAVF